MDNLYDDIKKYHGGELTTAEMYALERKALEDPFIADALEGNANIDQNDFDDDIASLQHSIQKRIDVNKTFYFKSFIARIAAGLLLISVTGYLIWSLTHSTENETLLTEKQSSPSSVTADSLTNDSTTTKGTPYISQAEPEVALMEEAPKKSKADPAEVLPSEPQRRENQGEDRVIADNVDRQGRSTSNTTEEAGNTEARGFEAEEYSLDHDKTKKELHSQKLTTPPSSSYRAADADKTNETKFSITGNVSFADGGQALPGVNVLIKGTNTGTVTDANGNYQILVKEKNPTLVFSFIGFQSVEAKAIDPVLNVALDADVSQLSEVVVVGAADTEEKEVYPTIEFAAPEGGRKAFKQYLEQNVRYPMEALKHNTEGKVTVQFMVDNNGQLSDFKIIKGLGYGCDEEVIRLIKEGPKWTPTKQNSEPIKDKVKVRMKFIKPKE